MNQSHQTAPSRRRTASTFAVASLSLAAFAAPFGQIFEARCFGLSALRGFTFGEAEPRMNALHGRM